MSTRFGCCCSPSSIEPLPLPLLPLLPMLLLLLLLGRG
jgi:hypothetical protein